MFLRVANSIDNRCVVQAPEDETFIQAGSHYDINVIDRRLYVHKHATGCCEPTPIYRCEGMGLAIRRTLTFKLPAFSVDHVEFVIDDDMLFWEIPLDHDLPWSNNRPTRRVAHVVRENLKTRLTSARLHGIHVEVVVNRVPSWARGVLEPTEWMQLVRGEKLTW